jgi:subtilisin family serine protease
MNIDWWPGMPREGDADPLDVDNGHGTHVSGILAGNNEW